MVIQLYYVILLRKCCRLGTTIYPYCRKPFWTQPASRQLMLLAVVMWRLLLGSQQFTSSWGTKWLLYDWRSCTSVWDFGGTWCDLSESWPLFFCGALVSQPQVCSWNEPLRLADKQSFDFCGQLRNNYASDSGGVLPLVRSQQCAWRGVFIASFLFRHSTDATSLVFEDCLFEANSVGGVGGGAGHITGTVWVSELQLVAGSPELVTDVLLRQQLGPTLSTSAGLLGKVPWLAKAQTWTVAETSVQEVQRQTIKKANSAVISFRHSAKVGHSGLKCHQLCKLTSLMWSSETTLPYLPATFGQISAKALLSMCTLFAKSEHLLCFCRPVADSHGPSVRGVFMSWCLTSD